MLRWRALSRTQRVAAVLLAAGALAGGVGFATASDHQDTPLVELNPRMDLTDVYAFPGSQPGRIVLVMNTSGFLSPGQTPTAAFDPNVLYQFKVDNNGDAIEDKVIQVTFKGTTPGTQQVTVRGPATPTVTGAMMNTVNTGAATLTGDFNTVLGSAGAIQAFAGPRDDPFFLDLEAFFCILPDRRPVSGDLSQPCALPSVGFRTPGVNYIAGYNVLSIVVELPSSMLENGAPGKLGIWGTISR
ncbi:MAG: DUF4331 family protein [Gemmatimonadales bacterium]